MLNFLHTESSENNIVATSFRWARPIGNLEAVWGSPGPTCKWALQSWRHPRLLIWRHRRRQWTVDVGSHWWRSSRTRCWPGRRSDSICHRRSEATHVHSDGYADVYHVNRTYNISDNDHNNIDDSDQGLTKAWLKRDQMALGVFPNSHECQKIEFPVLKKPSASWLVDRKPMGFWKFQGHQAPAVALRHVRYFDL